MIFMIHLAIILDPSVETNATPVSSTIEATWSVEFPNYTVSGIASCSSLAGTRHTAYPEYNNQITQGYQDDGTNCWCRMLYPVRSAWTFRYAPSTSSNCASGCAYNCGEGFHDYSEFRQAMFESAGN